MGSYGFSLDGISYQLDGSSYTFDGLQTGTDEAFYAEDGNLCVATLQATISENSDVFVDPADISITHAPCNGGVGTIDLEASGGSGSGIYFYSIDAGVTIQNTGVFSDVAGEYDILVSDNLGCEHTETVVITEPDVLTISEVLPTEVVLYYTENLQVKLR